MKSLLYLTSIVYMLCTGMVFGQANSNIRNTHIVKNGDVVNIRFSIHPDPISGKQKMTVNPILCGADGEQAVLPPATLSGRNKYKSDKRSGNVSENTHLADKKCNSPVYYTASVPFQPWMRTVTLLAEQQIEGCGKTEKPKETTLAADILIHHEVTPSFNLTRLEYELTELEKYDLENPFLHPAEDYEKRYEILIRDREKGTSKVIFQVNRTNIDINYYDNRQTLASIVKAYHLIKKEPNAVLKKIVIAGYASPEGSLYSNTRLSEARAKAVVDYLKPLLDNPSDEYFEVINGREDWAGLREMVDKCDMPWRQRVLHIIDGYTIEQQERKTRLQQLDGGIPYRYMLRNFYPELRSGGLVQVYYEIKRKGTISATVSDAMGRTTYVDPDSPPNRSVTIINKSIELMRQHKFPEALKILHEISDDSRTWNYIGVCNMMIGNSKQARQFLNKALENGDPYAAENINELKISELVSK